MQAPSLQVVPAECSNGPASALSPASGCSSASEFQSISEFYAGKNVLITGITGFLGKVLLEKLLWACPQVGRVYAMMRPKRGQPIEARLDELLSGALFDRLRRDRPAFREQIALVQGDMFEPGLGLTPEATAELRDRVHIVFHSAATVKFDEHLKIAVQMNLNGPRMVAELCDGMPNLLALVHVSTAYANCERKLVDEVVYPPEIHPQKLLDAIEWMDDGVLEQVTPRLLGQKPNTYTFTKQLAEFYLTNQFQHLPVIIVRPSIVGASWQDPFPGWVDNFNGPTGLFAATGKGLMRIMHGDRRCRADIVPVDTATNVLIASVWHQRVFKPTDRQPVYHAVMGPNNKFTWADVETLTPKFFTSDPMQSVIRPPKTVFTTSALWYQVNWLFNHQLPACLMDLYLYASGRRAVFLRVSNRINKSVRTLEYFTNREWMFNNANVAHAMDCMSPSDRLEFDCDASKIDIRDYMRRYCIGVKKYALKEPDAENKSAKTHLRRMQRLSLLWNALLFALVWRLMVKRVPVLSTMWLVMLNLAASLFQRLPRLARS